MNIVFHRYNSICEPGYIEAFKALGIEVVEDDTEIRQKTISGSERIRAISELILLNRPMFVFSINFFPYISEVCERLGVMYVCVSVDCPVAELFSVSIRNSCNRIFLFDHDQYLDVADLNPGHIFHLPLGVLYPSDDAVVTDDFDYDISFIGSLYNEKNPFERIRPRLDDRTRGLCEGLLSSQELLGGMALLGAIMQDGGNAVSRDIAAAFAPYIPDGLRDASGYVCDMTPFWAVHNCLGYELTVRDRLFLLATIAETFAGVASTHLFTRSDVSDLCALSLAINTHDGVNTLTQMPQIFRRSRINLNTTMRPIRTGLPQRIWDILGCGGFLLTDCHDEIPSYLTPGRHLEVYEDVNEACEKIDYYLKHTDERMEIARCGYEEVRAHHMVLHRISSMIGMIMKESSPGS